jgi:hypothetical protein
MPSCKRCWPMLLDMLDVFSDEVENLALVDRGGFVNLHTGEPMVDNDISPMLDCAGRWHLPERYHYRPWVHRYVDSQNHPGQQVTNPLPNTTNYLDSEIGKNFPLHEEFTNQYGQRDRIPY